MWSGQEQVFATSMISITVDLDAHVFRSYALQLKMLF